MNSKQTITLSSTEAAALLGVSADADEAQFRAAYLQKVREFPPDKFPDEFERIRDAYDLLKDPKHRARQILVSPDPAAPLSDLLIGLKPVRRFAGHKLWIDALKEKMKEARA